MQKVVVADYYFENLNEEKNALSKIGAEVFSFHCRTEEEVIEAAADCDALIVQFAPITRKVIEGLKKCRIIVRYAIGVDNIDIKAAEENGIYVANVPDYSLDEVSNHAIALLFACARKICVLDKAVRAGNYGYLAAKPMLEMQGRILGLLGLGRIPSLVAKKMGGFGLSIIAHDPYAAKERAAELGVALVSLDELLRRSDYLSVHCPLNDQTKHMLGRAEFQQMKRSAILINTARGAVICEEELIEALKAGEIAGAGLDVTEKEPPEDKNPLLAMENVILTPHAAWYTEESIKRLQRMAAEEAARVLGGEKPKNPVNRPSALR